MLSKHPYARDPKTMTITATASQAARIMVFVGGDRRVGTGVGSLIQNSCFVAPQAYVAFGLSSIASSS